MVAGQLPFFSRLIRSGEFHLDDAFWGSPTSTPYFQAGLLYGLRHSNLPAYSWFDRALGRELRMNVPSDALEVERRLRGTGRDSLLDGGGHGYFTLFRAGAENALSMSTLGSLKLMAHAFSFEMLGLSSARTRSVWSFLRSLGVEAWRAARETVRWARALGSWSHESAFLASRIFFQRLGWSFAHTKALVDMARGVPVIYLVYGNYDETAHRRGPRSPLARSELHRVDAYLAELYAMARAVERPYDVVILSDHGHVDSVPLEQRQGARLKSVLFDEGPAVPLSDDVARGLCDGRSRPEQDVRPREPFTPVVVECGNFAHVYLSGEREALDAHDVLARYPDMLARATRNPDVGLVAMKRGPSAALVVQGGVYGLEDLERAPLASEFSRPAVRDFLRGLPSMKTAGDLVLFGEAVRRGGTVGFAWEFGSHGGLTRTEANSLVCWPADAPVDLSGLSHCADLHDRLAEAYLEPAHRLRWAP
ncbi:type I phosphodiesterase/nucleotide pyrophosphatase family protein [Myxococcus stipitatus DSM 14675]|uniref:Type I phosphodiesterase/nucleotide pyrophosphatase family protein n=1 Tax=Myxococcus stipitatus (strain DSM 14675 / JCM 12634 / Mx s8) TaxID=1278073 RepID=L7UGU3_MYXSD|nr:alkaline phosphatase family protein [Myxococcus stipitatus]AGC46777.1 type I phosphodiesterase/nucleotide pyrophosphatase family protein [Myxococcus stipitatus DSM 14675]